MSTGAATASEAPRGWNWGAFLLTWIWGIFHNTWIALLALIPGVNLIMMFVLGAKGNEWAWKAKDWQSVEHFQKTQKTWARVGAAVWIGIILLYVVLFVVAAGS